MWGCTPRGGPSQGPSPGVAAVSCCVPPTLYLRATKLGLLCDWQLHHMCLELRGFGKKHWTWPLLRGHGACELEGGSTGASLELLEARCLCLGPEAGAWPWPGRQARPIVHSSAQARVPPSPVRSLGGARPRRRYADLPASRTQLLAECDLAVLLQSAGRGGAES